MKKLVIAFVFCTYMVSPRAENVLLISVDTLRSDRLSCYGYQFNRTPNIDRLAEQGTLFEHAFTEFPLTLPAHSTLFTGTYPFQHGVRENIGFTLSDEATTLAEVFQERGFTTGAFVGSYVLTTEFGMGQGFGTFDEDFGVQSETLARRTAVQRPAEEVVRRFLEWFGKNRSVNVFAFVHFFDVHTPRPYGYDWEVSTVDRSIGRILEFLQENGLLEQTHIVLTSDHGEGLDEHGESGHGFFLYDSTLHIPLILRPAARLAAQSKKVAFPVSLVDVMPTILDLAGLPSPASVQGKSLFRWIVGRSAEERGIYAETYIPQLHFDWSPLRSYRLGRYKFIDAPRPELYDVGADPDEKNNLFSENQALANRLRSGIEEFLGRFGSPNSQTSTSGTVTRETMEKLASLGYVSISRRLPRHEFGKGIDPKDRIHAFETFHRIINEMETGRPSPGLSEQLSRLRLEAPEVRGLSFLEGRLHEKQGRYQEALRSFQKAQEEDSENLQAGAGAARMLMRLKRNAEAEEAFRELVSRDPADFRSRNNLAGLYMLRGDPSAAEAELLKAVESAPYYESGWQNLARVYVASRRWEEAEAALRKALLLNSKNASSHLLLSRVLTELGQTAEAARERQIAIDLDPRLGQ